MRRAAALAIALVVGLLLLPSGRIGRERAPRHDAHAPEEPEAATSAAREAPEPTETAQEPAVAREPRTVADGVVTDAQGKPLAGLRLLAIPRDQVGLWDAEDPFTPPGRSPDVPFAHTDVLGAFRFEDLASGDYRLGIDEDWMLEQRLTFRAETRGIRAVAARAFTVTVLALDLATSEPIDHFVVHYGTRTGPGSDGVFHARLCGDASGANVACRVEADGYHPAAARVTREPGSSKVWLTRIAEPLLSVRARFDDGAPCEEEATVVVRHRGDYRGATIPARGGRGGVYQVPLPPGCWFVDFRPAHSDAFRRAWTAEVDLAAGESREIFLELERGGEVVVRHPGSDGAPWDLGVTQFRGDVMVGRATLTLEGTERILRHVEPGRYVLRVVGSEGADAGWSRTVEVTTGSRHELTVE